jgi:hypothetical protein
VSVKIGGYPIIAQDFSASKPVTWPDVYVMLKVKKHFPLMGRNTLPSP